MLKGPVSCNLDHDDNDYSSKLNHNNDVKFSSDDLDLHGAIINVHLKALDLYAAIMGKTANFSKAEKGAERMISMAPSEPIGHIRLGDLYMMRSNQLRAIQVYKNGYQYMKNDLDRDLLIQRRDTAIIQSKKKFDIIGHLPFDLIHPTLCDLSSSSSPSSLTASITISSHQYHRPRHKSNNLFILLDVSKTWRNKIIDCASLWRTISLGDIDLENVKRWIPYIKQHIIELSIFNFKPNHVLCEMLFLQLIQGGFYQLKSLLMNVPVLRNENIFFEALSSTAKTLKQLHIFSYTWSRKINFLLIPFKTLLTLCTSLEKLHYAPSNSVTFEQALSLPAALDGGTIDHESVFFSTTLTDLCFDIQSITAEDLKRIFAICPKLRRLRVLSCLEENALEVVSRHGSKDLRLFEFNNILWKDQVYYDDDDKDEKKDGGYYSSSNNQAVTQQTLPTTTSMTHEQNEGIQHIALKTIDLSNFISFFAKHSTTLRTLQWERNPYHFIDDEDETKEAWQSLIRVCRFHHLQSLGFSFGISSLASTVITVSLLQKATELRHLSFLPYSILSGHETITAIHHLRYLKTLCLYQCHSDNETMTSLFRTLANDSRNEEGFCKLEEVRFASNQGYRMDVLMEYLADIHTLRHVTLDSVNGLSRPYMIEWCEKLQNSTRSCIRSIKLYRLKYFDNTILHKLAGIKQLESVELGMLSYITRAGLKAFDGTGILLKIKNDS